MKKVIFISMIVLAVFEVFTVNLFAEAKADKSTIQYQEQAIIYLCDENAKLALALDTIVGINVLSFETRTIILPTKDFYRLIKETVVGHKRKHNYAELLDLLQEENKNMILLLKQRTFVAERIK